MNRRCVQSVQTIGSVLVALVHEMKLADEPAGNWLIFVRVEHQDRDNCCPEELRKHRWVVSDRWEAHIAISNESDGLVQMHRSATKNRRNPDYYRPAVKF